MPHSISTIITRGRFVLRIKSLKKTTSFIHCTIHFIFAYSSSMGESTQVPPECGRAGIFAASATCPCRLRVPRSATASSAIRGVWCTCITCVAAKGWSLQFLEEDLNTSLRRKFTSRTSRRSVERGSTERTLADHQALEHGIFIGRGGMWLQLTPEQYGRMA